MCRINAAEGIKKGNIILVFMADNLKLIIEGIPADLSKDISADITYSLADIRTPDKRQVNYSRTIQLNGTATNNYIFGNIFNIDVENDIDPLLPNVGVNYSPKKLAKAMLLRDNVQVFDGTLRLWKIVSKKGVITYECSLFGKLFDLFGSLGEAKLVDLDFSDLNHAVSWDNIKLTWEDSFAGGFRYPLIDYGGNVGDSQGRITTLKFGSLVPAIRYVVYFDKIFSSVGANYTLNFSDRTVLDQMLVTPPKGEIVGSPRLFSGKSTVPTPPTFPVYEDIMVGLESSMSWLSPRILDSVLYNNIFTITDGTGSWYNPYTDDYVYWDDRKIYFNRDVETSFRLDIKAEIWREIEPGAGAVWVEAYTTRSGVLHTYLGRFEMVADSFAHNTITGAIEIPRKSYLNGDQFIVNLITDPYCRALLVEGTKLEAVSPNDISSYPLLTDDIYEMNKSVPPDIKQVDFLKDFIKYFNVFATQDRDNPLIYIFTPQVDFYNKEKSLAIDWSGKIDYSEKIEQTPISQLTAKEYLFTWKQDKDYYNDFYFTRNKEVYGQVTYITDTDVVTKKEKIEFLFSPACMTRFTNSNIICPAIYKVEMVSGVPTKKVDKFNSRLLIWGGTFDAGHNIALLNPNGTTYETITVYPYAGHINHPTAPTYDLNFGNTNSDLPTSSVNQFSKYWGRSLREANHKDGKLIECVMLLTPEDIESLDFSALYKIGDRFFRLNKIDGYNPFELATCDVELIKVIDL
jgi:hypothetical protein